MKREFETVYTVVDYFDGPRSGIADFQGTPHYYERVLDGSFGRSDIFILSPIDDQTFQLALEDWEIWRRWERAFHSGFQGQASHPALKEDRKRYEELKAILPQRLKIKPDRRIEARGDFKPVPFSGTPVPGILPDLKVSWTVVD